MGTTVTCGHLWSPEGRLWQAGQYSTGAPSVRMVPISDPGHPWPPGPLATLCPALAYLHLPQVRKGPKPLGVTGDLPCPLATLDRPWTG